MSNVVKLRGLPVIEPVQFFQVDNGKFGGWYFDIDTFDFEPEPNELMYIGHENRRAYYASQLRPVKVRVTACINDRGLGCQAVNIWVTPEQFLTRSYVYRYEVESAMRDAINTSHEWITETLDMLGFSDARDEVQRKVGG